MTPKPRKGELEATALDLIRHIYAAVLDPDEWQIFVDKLAHAHDGAAVAFSFQVPSTPSTLGVSFSHGFDRTSIPVLAKYIARGLPWDEARRNHFRDRFGLASSVFPDADVADTDFYKEWFAPQNLAPVCPIGHTIAMHQGVPIATVVIYRQGGGGPFGPEDLDLGNLLVPHLRQAYELHANQTEKAALGEAINRLPMGVLLLDSQGEKVLANEAIETITKLEDGFAIVDDRPRAQRDPEDQHLRELIETAVAGASDSAGLSQHAMSVTRPSGRRAFPLMLAPLLSTNAGGARHDAAVVLFISDLDATSVPRSDTLRSLYSLTHAEIELVELLCEGCSLDEAAKRRDVTMNTARSQLKQIFAKTNTSRQGELVRLVLAGVAPIRTP